MWTCLMHGDLMTVRITHPVTNTNRLGEDQQPDQIDLDFREYQYSKKVRWYTREFLEAYSHGKTDEILSDRNKYPHTNLTPHLLMEAAA